ncbi:MAG: TonB-dependent receptor [Gemmatimonadetes bacterium]|nr:TonB-dependent receptor [Gemmatimonadota bacterium]
MRSPILMAFPHLVLTLSLLLTQQTLVAQTPPADSGQRRDSALARVTVLDPVVVTAERRPTRSSDAAAAVRVISADEIARKGGADLVKVLQDVPGVQVDPLVGSGAGIMLQGLGSDRVLVLVDGSPLVGRIGGELDLSRMDPSMFRGIEIVEGPQSTLYGSNALGGVVNLLTRSDLGSRIEATGSVGSAGQRDGRARASGLFGRWGGSVEAGRRTMDLAPGTGPSTVGFAKRWDGLARAQADLGGSTVEARVMGVQENQQYRSGVTATTVNHNDNWQLDGLAQLTLGRTEVRAHLSGYDHRFASGGVGAAPGTPDWDRQRVADIEGLHRGSAGRAQWLTGAKLEREWIIADRVAAGSERGGFTGAGYGSLEIPVGRVFQLWTGARFTASEAWGVNAAPRAGVTLRSPAGAYFKLAGARGFRAPSFKDLYTEFVNTQARYRVQGNVDLTPETSWNATGEVGFTGARVWLYGRGYTNRLRNFIQTVQTGVSAGILQFQYQNIGKARTQGLEVGGSANAGIATASASYTFLDAKDDSTHLNLTGRGQSTGKGSLTVSPSRSRASLRGEAVVNGRVLLSRTGAGVETYQDAYTHLNASVITTLPLGIQATLGVENLANTIPARALTALGRRWHVTVTWGAGW